jgi:hypothetical protein
MSVDSESTSISSPHRADILHDVEERGGAIAVCRKVAFRVRNQVVAEPAREIEHPDQDVSQLHLGHLPMRQLVVHQVFTFTLHCLGELADDQHEHFALVAIEAFAGGRIVPPVRVGRVDLAGEFVQVFHIGSFLRRMVSS